MESSLAGLDQQVGRAVGLHPLEAGDRRVLGGPLSRRHNPSSSQAPTSGRESTTSSPSTGSIGPSPSGPGRLTSITSGTAISAAVPQRPLGRP